MKIFTQLADLKQQQFSQTAVALGTFDGVHIGHQKIIHQAVGLAASSGGASVVFTFANHPLSVINPRRCPPQIVTAEYKSELIQNLGVDVLLSIPFTEDFLRLTPEEFIILLLSHLKPANLVIGPNYHFGHKGSGTPETLKIAGQKHGFNVVVHPAVYVQNIMASSTSIRRFIHEGNIDQATLLLGRPPRVGGTVVTGDGRGKKLGYPTANIAIDNKLVIPANGVYAVEVQLDDKRYNGVANIGINPTFTEQTRRIEVFLLDFDANLYDQIILVDFLAKLRDEKAFHSVDELTNQIAQDISNAQKYYH